MKSVKFTILLASLAAIGLTGCGSDHLSPKKYAQVYERKGDTQYVYAYGYPYWYAFDTYSSPGSSAWMTTTRPSGVLTPLPYVGSSGVTGKNALVAVDKSGKPENEEQVEEGEDFEGTIDEAPDAASEPSATGEPSIIEEHVEPPSETTEAPSAPVESAPADSSSSSSGGDGGGGD
jgi:hypothetical protein